MEGKESLNKMIMDEQAKLENLYQNKYDEIKREIVSAIFEGTEKGLRDGITDGISGGLKDCLYTGFLNVKDADTKSLEDIMEELASGIVASKVKDRITKDVGPALKRRADKSCDRIIEKIEEDKEKVADADIRLIRAMHVERIGKEKAKEIRTDVEKRLPKDFMSVALFDGMLEAISECLIEAATTCNERIDKIAHADKSIE